MHPIPALLSRCFRLGLPPGLFAGLLLLAGTGVTRAQPVPAPELQLILSGVTTGVDSKIIAVGYPFEAEAKLVNMRIFDNGVSGEPVILSLTSPLLTTTPELALWGGYLSRSLIAPLAPSTPGRYAVAAAASTGDWLEYFADVPWMLAWLDTAIPPADQLETTVTEQVTVVGLASVTPSTLHAAAGDTVTFAATMTPVDAFDWVHWLWYADNPGTVTATGQTYERVMDVSSRDANGVIAVAARCGNSQVTVPITVYQVTDVSASPPLVAAGDLLTFTATIDPPGGSPPPIEWFLNGVSQGTTATGATFSPASPPPGYYTVTAKMGTSEIYTGATVVGIGSVSMSGPDYNGPVPAGEVRYIYQNDSYTFTATAAPEGAAWPLNQPQWTISGNTTTGPDAPGTFAALSTSIGDFKTAIASCGTSSESVGIIVFNVTGGPVPVANFSGRYTKQFGIGEVIDFKAYVSPPDLTFEMAGLSWDFSVPPDAVVNTNTSPPVAVAAAGGSTPSAYAAASAASAPTPSAKASVSYVFEPAVYSAGVKRQNQIRLNLSFPIIAPNEAFYRKPSGPVSATAEAAIPSLSVTVIGGPLPVHHVNKIMALQALEIYLLPATMSWMNIMFLEGSATIFNTGFIADERGSVRNHPEWTPGAVNPPIDATLGCMVARIDLTGYSSPAVPPISGVGDSTVKLPLLYQYKNKNGLDVKVQFGTPVDSWKSVNVNGDVSGKKQGQSYSAGYSDTTRTYSLPSP